VPRSKRPTVGGIYHLITTSTKPDDFFREGFDRIEFVSELSQMLERFDWTCISACLMTTHYHLIAEVPDNTLSAGMQRLNWRYARAFNRRHQRRGHHVGGKFTAVPILSEQQLVNAFRYVARNPVKAGICGRPQDWPWSSYARTVGLAEGFSFIDATRVLECFGASLEVTVERLRGFVEWDSD
jgi:putative transposase